MKSWQDAPWRGGRAGGYSRRSLEGDPRKGPPPRVSGGPPNYATRQGGFFILGLMESQALLANDLFLSANLGTPRSDLERAAPREQGLSAVLRIFMLQLSA